MADLLIQGMRMPHLCIDCRLNYGEKRPEHGLTIFCKYSNGVVLPKAIGLVGRLPTCGLLELPEHGDLIDIRTILEIVMQYAPDDDGSCSKVNVDLRELLDEIENAPIIVPSNEEETE